MPVRHWPGGRRRGAQTGGAQTGGAQTAGAQTAGAQTAGAQTGDIGSRPLRLVDGTVLTAPGSRGAGWRLHMGDDPPACRFTGFALTDGRGGERLERFPAMAQEVRIAASARAPRRLARAGRGAG